MTTTVSEKQGRRTGSRRWAHLRNASIVSLTAHLAAGVAMATLLVKGLETNPDWGGRLRFIRGETSLWIGSWLLWHLAALSILYFAITFVRAHRDHRGADRPLLQLGLMACGGAVAIDLAAETIEIGLLPGLAGSALDAPDGGPPHSEVARLFLLAHRTAVLLTGYLANGLYTLAAILLTLSTRKDYRPWVWIAGLGVGISGAILSGAVLAGSVEGIFWSNLALVPFIAIWQAGIAIHAARCVGSEPDA